MARQIIWTKRAQKERTDILKFWKEHNQSITFSRKLNDLIKDSLILISRHPSLVSTKLFHLSFIINSYAIIYRNKTNIYI